MFETIESSLNTLAYFAAIGFLLGLFYELLRIMRLAFAHGTAAVFVEDLLFLVLTALITYAYSMELGNGQFRYYYLFAELFGAAVYFVTLGKLINTLFRKCIGTLKMLIIRICRIIIRPIKKLSCKILQKTGKLFSHSYKNALKAKKFVSARLYSVTKVLYNKKGKNGEKAGEKRNVIKAEVKKLG